jgi:Transglutaminase-like superfamily
VNDKYLCIGRQVFEVLCESSSEISLEPRNLSSSIGVPDVLKVVANLVDRGILVTDSNIGKEIDPVVAASQVTSTLADPPADRTSLWMLRVPSFLRACRRAARDLAHKPLHRTVQEVKDLRRRQSCGRGTWDPAKARALIGDFAAMRYIFPRSYLCLFDSLALVHFLAAYGQFPTWVFGVDAEPFTAHCWLQEGSILLNDTLANVSRYTPIMAV